MKSVSQAIMLTAFPGLVERRIHPYMQQKVMQSDSSFSDIIQTWHSKSTFSLQGAEHVPDMSVTGLQLTVTFIYL